MKLKTNKQKNPAKSTDLGEHAPWLRPFFSSKKRIPSKVDCQLKFSIVNFTANLGDSYYIYFPGNCYFSSYRCFLDGAIDQNYNS